MAMTRSRASRSKNGCLSCRRRKVRCDELKPICTACDRLELSCSFHSGNAADVEKPRYRVRFVTSSYSRLPRSNNEPRDPCDAGRERCRTPTPMALNGPDEPENSNEKVIPVLPEVQSATPAALFSQTSSESSSALPERHGCHASPRSEQLGLATDFEPHSSVDGWEMDAHVAHIPPYFDLNLNFDALGERWPVAPSATLDTSDLDSCFHQHDLATGRAPPDAEVAIEAGDHPLIQHYLNVMTQYTKMRSSGDESIYTQIFSNFALFHLPLYHAIMAWTALHLGHSRDDSGLIQKAEVRYRQAVSLVHQDKDAWQHFELSLVTIWFALQYELLVARGIDSFCRHLELAADLIDAARSRQAHNNMKPPALGPIGARVLIWLGSYDARASWIGGSGCLLRNLELFRSHCNVLGAACPASQPGPDGRSLEMCLRLTLEFDILDNKIAQLHRRPTAPPAAVWSAVQSDLLLLQNRLENSDSIALTLASILGPERALNGAITTKIFNDLLLLSSFYSVIISFHRVLPPDGMAGVNAELLSADEAASRILRASACVLRLRTPSPSNIWPRILFMAGIETVDPVYQDWTVKVFGDARPWGGNFCKTQALLMRIIERQSREGIRVDYLDVMKESGGLFII